MHLAVVLDPLERLKVWKDSTYAIMRAAQARGHDVSVMEQGDLVLEDGKVLARARRLTLVDDALAWYSLGETELLPLSAFDAVLMRKDPPFDLEYVYSTYLLELAECQGARIFNRPAAIRDYNEKLAIARFPDLIPPTRVTRDMGLLLDFIARERDVVVKPLDGMGGRQVFRIQEGDLNTRVILETLTDHGRRTIMAQRYLPAIREGDKRILLIGGEPVPWSLARIPQPGELRGNLAAGGRGEARPLSACDREIANRVGPCLAQAGLFLVGLDVIGEHLTEINVTSPTGMREIEAQTGYDAAGLFVEKLAAHLAVK